MPAQTFVGLLPQVQALPVWQQFHPNPPESQPDIINPSRSITPEDEIYLRDYALAAAVISWDECIYGTPAQLTAADITNIAIAGDTVWYQIQLHRAIPMDIETFYAHRLQIQQHSSKLNALTAQPKPQPQQVQPNASATQEAQQLVGWTGDSTGCQLFIDWQAVAEYKSGVAWGKLDAANRIAPICTEASCPYSQGYLQGYNEILASKQHQETVAASQWSVIWNPTCYWYDVWIGNTYVGKESNHEEAELFAQYLTTEGLRKRHRESVLAAEHSLNKKRI